VKRLSASERECPDANARSTFRSWPGSTHGCPIQRFCSPKLPRSVARCPSRSRYAGPSHSPLAGEGWGEGFCRPRAPSIRPPEGRQLKPLPGGVNAWLKAGHMNQRAIPQAPY
jgi:hypothetical protein